MKKSVRRIISSVLALGVSASIVVAAIAPLLLPPTAVAQTNPQTTDIFTGQFIPAYYGAAYDPSEAFKHMAGATIYVFAYDTWGRVVNDFAYKTQVRADGSFQAAGLPNASHYGIFYPDLANYLSNYFRSPREEDNLQATFAYQQATFPDEDGQVVPNTQIPGEKVPEEIKGARVFLTSSRNVDIRNHINIFPLVPTNVLSVIIKDTDSNPDFANINKPYEIYAQRVATKAQPAGSGSCDTATNPECFGQNLTKSYRANGPVIRGRTIYYTPMDGDQPCGRATIFQAFAPAGTYAITYWRPDGRDAQNQITYLNFNGTQPLNTDYNGIAVEVAEVEPFAAESNPISFWGNLSKRCITKEDTPGEQNYWDAYPKSASIWGVLYQGENSETGTIAGGLASVRISDNSLSFVEPDTRKCSAGGGNSGNVRDLGVYIFSTCNVKSNSFTARLSVMDGISGGGSGGVSGGGSNAGGNVAGSIQTNSGIEVSVNGQQGPSRKDVAITVNASDGASGQLVLGGKPVRNTWLSLEVDGHYYSQVAKTDNYGYFVIGANYFRHSGKNDYRVIVHSAFGTTAYQEFAIDSSSLANFSNGNLTLGSIALDKPTNSVSQFLANLNLNKFFDQFRIQPALAAYNEEGATWGLDGDLFANEEWVFYLDTSNLFGQQSAFTPTNYSLRHADIKIPPGYETYRRCIVSKSVRENPPCAQDHAAANEALGIDIDTLQFGLEYNLFERNSTETTGSNGQTNVGGAEYGKGMVTPSGGEDEQIIAVALQPNQDSADRIDDYMKYLLKLLGPDPVVFTLRVKFVYTPKSDSEIAEEGEDYNTQNGQDEISRPPAVLTAEWPITIQADGDNYKVMYEPVQLVPQGGDICIDASWNDPTEWVEEFMCNAVLGGISAIKSVFDFLADYILKVDPLAFGTVTRFWNMIRNIINSLAIIILVASGLAIMFRYEPNVFNIKSVITKLIVAIVLVNFSILVVQVAIDITNVIAYGGYRFLLNSISQEPIGGSGIAGAAAALGALGVAALGAMIAMTGGVGAFIGTMLFFLAIILFFGYVIIRIGFDYAFRVAVLIICIVLAPVAFASRVMPGTQKYYGRWKGILIGTLIAQITVAFMLALSIGLLRIGVAENGFWNSLLTLLLAFALFYYTTRAPRMVAGMVGEDLSSSIESLTKKGISGAWGLGKQQKLSMVRRKQLDEDRKEKGLPTGFSGAKQRFNLRKKYVGIGGLVTGVSPDEIDKAEKEAHAAAETELDVVSHANFPHRSVIPRKVAHEKQSYQLADETAGMFSRGKLTNARENTSLVDGRYGYTLDNLDATGKTKKQHYTDSHGNAAERDQIIGDLSDFGTGTAAVYAQGFKQVFDDQVVKLGDEDAQQKAMAAISRAKNWITTGAPAAHVGMNEDFKGFFEKFEYNNQEGHKAWAHFYRDLGEDIDPEVAKYPDMYGKVTEDFIYKAAGKGDSTWEASLRTGNSQAKSGISSRHRIDIATTTDLQLPAVPAGFQEITLTNLPPAGTAVTGNELKTAMDAIKVIEQAYADVAGGREISNLRAYQNAVTTLRRLGYS